MKNLFTIFAFMLLLASSALAQIVAEMKIAGEPKEEPSELVGKEIRDANGDVCAGLIINTDLKGLVFQANNGIVKTNQSPGRFFLFLSPGENVVEVFSSDFSPLKIILNEQGIRLRSGQTWSLKITGEKSIPVNFIITPSGTKLFVDNEPKSFAKPPQLKMGKHAIRLEKQGFNTIFDTINVSQENTLFPYNLREKDIYDPGTSSDDKNLIKATVVNFKSSDDLTVYALIQMQQSFKNALEATGKYKIVPLSNDEIDALIAQYETGVVKEENKQLLAGISRKTNQVFKGSIGKLGEAWTVSIQRIDIQERRMDNNAAFIRFNGTQNELIDQITIAAQKIAGTYVEESNLWYYLGGAALLGGGAAVLLGGKTEEAAPLTSEGLPLPPSKPN